jgi:hypothetical protein
MNSRSVIRFQNSRALVLSRVRHLRAANRIQGFGVNADAAGGVNHYARSVDGGGGVD